MSEQGRKEDGGKLRYDLVPVLAFEDQVKGLTYGATKYDDNNWRNVPEGRKRYMAAAMRHLQEYRKGNMWDDEQGIHHLSAAINNFSFIVEKDLQGWEDVHEDSVSKEISTSEEYTWIELKSIYDLSYLPVKTKVDVKFKNGEVDLAVSALWLYQHMHYHYSMLDIVAYRVV